MTRFEPGDRATITLDAGHRMRAEIVAVDSYGGRAVTWTGSGFTGGRIYTVAWFRHDGTCEVDSSGTPVAGTITPGWWADLPPMPAELLQAHRDHVDEIAAMLRPTPPALVLAAVAVGARWICSATAVALLVAGVAAFAITGGRATLDGVPAAAVVCAALALLFGAVAWLAAGPVGYRVAGVVAEHGPRRWRDRILASVDERYPTDGVEVDR